MTADGPLAPEPRALLTVDEAAMACGVTGKTIRNWMASGHLKYQLDGPAKRIRISASSLREALGTRDESA